VPGARNRHNKDVITRRLARLTAALLSGLFAFCVPASAQVRVQAVEMPVSAPGFRALGSAPALTAMGTAPSLTAVPIFAAPSILAAPAALPALAPALAAAPAAAAAAAPEAERPSAEAAPAAAPSTEGSLWNGGIPDSQARRLLSKAHWETTKFFLTSRVVLLREFIEDQKAKGAEKELAVKDLESMWLDWRVQGYSGRVTTAGFEVADRESIRKQAFKFFDRHWGKDEASRAAFRRYMDRVDATVPLARPSNYRKHAFAAPFDLANLTAAEVPARLDSLLTGEHAAEIQRHRDERQAAVLSSFKAAANASIVDVNQSLPEGKRIVAVILLGSYAINQSTPKSDIDYQLLTQDGGTAAIKPFAEALERNWKENKLEKIEAFQFTLPPSRAVVVESFQEGYQVISLDPAAVKALSKDAFAPAAPTSWSRLRGQLFAEAYRAWCWGYLRLAELCQSLKTFAK
jgi:hypothetical protein